VAAAIVEDPLPPPEPPPSHGRRFQPRNPNYAQLRANFGFAPIDTIKRTFGATTQFARQVITPSRARIHLRTRFPACNVPRRNEAVATDTIYSDTPAVDSGVLRAQLFIGKDSLLADAYPLHRDKDFILSLEDNIRERGAMNQLLSDRAQVEISKRIHDILRAYSISDWQSEPYHQHQNPSETRYRTIKEYTNTIMNRTGAPDDTWLLCLLYVCYLLNHLANETLKWRTPLEVATGFTPDISALLEYSFWQPVYLKTQPRPQFPSGGTERLGRFVGISSHVGDALTYKVLTDDTRKVLHTSNIRSALDVSNPNLRATTPIQGEEVSPSGTQANCCQGSL
jgi:hypothetical protein